MDLYVPMNRYFIELSFRGTGFHGWQIQPNSKSIQEVLEESLTMLLKHPIRVTGAGRTDSGVHASYYVAHFDANKIKNLAHLTKSLNACLGKDISILRICPQDKNTHARFDARMRCYKYVIIRNKQPFTNELGYYFHGMLDIEMMNKASEIIRNTKDFTSFAKLHSDNKTNICKVRYAKWIEHNGYLVFTIRADRFLRNMVRSIVGTVLDVGKGKISINEFQQIIDSLDNQRASASAPARGLYLADIKYPKIYALYNPGKNKFLPFI